jgi:hypothetical protein
MKLRSANYVNDNTEAHVKEPNKEHGKDHAGETSEGHGRDQGEEAREEAYQPRGATPSLQIPPVQASGSREGSKKECHQDGPRSTKMRPADRKAVDHAGMADTPIPPGGAHYLARSIPKSVAYIGRAGPFLRAAYGPQSKGVGQWQ